MFVATAPRPAGDLLAGVAHLLVPQWSVAVTVHPFGSLLTAGASSERNEHWLVAGRPTCDPWGAPDHGQDLKSLLGDLETWGAAAMSMTAGPALAIDLASGASHRTLGGIIGFGRHRDDLQIRSTVGESEPPPGAAIIEDQSPAFSVDRLVEEVDTHAPRATAPIDLRAFTSHPWPSVAAADRLGEVYRIDATTAVFRPPDAVGILAAPHLYASVRDVVLPELHHRCVQLGLQLYAPLFERPVLDQLGFAIQAAP